MTERLTRTAQVTFTVLNGADILAEGQETARHLWNYTRYCVVSYNRKVQRWREGKIYGGPTGPLDEYNEVDLKWHLQFRSLAGRLPKYPGLYTMDHELRDHWTAKRLSDRCFTYTLKDFDIAMRSWFSNLKQNPRARPPRYREEPRPLTFELGRNAKHLGNWTFRLTVLGGHIKDRHAVVRVHIRPGVKVRDVKLIRVNPDLSGTAVLKIEAMESLDDGIAAIDLGVINLAVVAFQDGTSILYSGRGLLSALQWLDKRAAKCKPSGWQKGKAVSKASERLINYRRKAGNISRLAIHNLTRSIIDECVKHGVGTIVVGDLTHIRDGKDYGKRRNLKIHRWPFREIVRQLEYKGEEVGIKVVKVSEAYTSRSCHICGTIGSRVKRGLFRCADCGIEINADVNGAFGILNKVSPVPVKAGIGVEANLPGLPSPPARTGRIGEAQLPSQINPTWVAKFDLRNWSLGSPVATETMGVASELTGKYG